MTTVRSIATDVRLALCSCYRQNANRVQSLQTECQKGAVTTEGVPADCTVVAEDEMPAVDSVNQMPAVCR
jgi:hypothetical protein